ncbi:MAG: hypothetical protein DELT_00410 [Desulfovibrio sp.]
MRFTMVTKNKKKPEYSGVLLEVADDAGKPLLVIPEEQVLRQKLRHKGVIVCLRNLQGRVFLYRRPQSTTVRHSGLWSLAASGRVIAGESFHAAAERHLAHELSITDIDMAEVARLAPSVQTGKAEAAIFLTARTSILPRIPDYSPQTAMFADQEELRALLRDFPHMVTPFLQLVLPYLF